MWGGGFSTARVDRRVGVRFPAFQTLTAPSYITSQVERHDACALALAGEGRRDLPPRERGPCAHGQLKLSLRP
eukprot:2772387-Prymnesium_polylepis.1